MGIFQSDNIWKRQARQREAALHPLTPYQQWKKDLRSSCLWLIGGALVLLLSAVALAVGAMELSLTTGVILFIVAAYCAMTVRQLADLLRSRPAPDKKKRKR